MKIRMYNVGYGDCFCIRDRKKSMLVDFGTANSRIEGKPRNETFDVIISDLATIEKKSLLLTNFSLDHISGLLYMMRTNPEHCEFSTIYLPDLFSKPEYAKLLALILLADLVKDSALPSRQISLFALVEALIRHPMHVELLRRGKEFNDRYHALWPDCDILLQETEAVYAQLAEPYRETFEQFVSFCEKLREIVETLTKDEMHIRKDFTPVSVLERELKDLRQGVGYFELLQEIHEKKIPLKSLRNKISVVFQNRTDGDLNLLFTGDIEQEYLQKIMADYDDSMPIYEHYWCIKVPFHGNQNNYYDFYDQSPENMLISNGIHFSNSKNQSKELRTSGQYGGLFYIPETHMYCTSCDCCDAYLDGCTCKEYDIISPRYYKDV